MKVVVEESRARLSREQKDTRSPWSSFGECEGGSTFLQLVAHRNLEISGVEGDGYIVIGLIPLPTLPGGPGPGIAQQDGIRTSREIREHLIRNTTKTIDRGVIR